jgi:uncharacterized protein YkwD
MRISAINLMLTLLSQLFFIKFNFISAQNNTTKNLVDTKNIYLHDSVHQIEIIAGQKFHQLLNSYRLKKNKQELIWDENLWLTADNHNYYMSYHENLSHQQKKFTKHFTGKEPLDRYHYVIKEKCKISTFGENIQYFTISNNINIEEISSNIANEAFNNWKESKPHHKNMIERDYKKHGIAFKIDELKVWGTNVFGSNDK